MSFSFSLLFHRIDCFTQNCILNFFFHGSLKTHSFFLFIISHYAFYGYKSASTYCREGSSCIPHRSSESYGDAPINTEHTET